MKRPISLLLALLHCCQLCAEAQPASSTNGQFLRREVGTCHPWPLALKLPAEIQQQPMDCVKLCSLVAGTRTVQVQAQIGGGFQCECYGGGIEFTEARAGCQRWKLVDYSLKPMTMETWTSLSPHWHPVRLNNQLVFTVTDSLFGFASSASSAPCSSALPGSRLFPVKSLQDLVNVQSYLNDRLGALVHLNASFWIDDQFTPGPVQPCHIIGSDGSLRGLSTCSGLSLYPICQADLCFPDYIASGDRGAQQQQILTFARRNGSLQCLRIDANSNFLASDSCGGVASLVKLNSDLVFAQIKDILLANDNLRNQSLWIAGPSLVPLLTTKTGIVSGCAQLRIGSNASLFDSASVTSASCSSAAMRICEQTVAVNPDDDLKPTRCPGLTEGQRPFRQDNRCLFASASSAVSAGAAAAACSATVTVGTLFTVTSESDYQLLRLYAAQRLASASAGGATRRYWFSDTRSAFSAKACSVVDSYGQLTHLGSAADCSNLGAIDPMLAVCSADFCLSGQPSGRIRVFATSLSDVHCHHYTTSTVGYSTACPVSGTALVQLESTEVFNEIRATMVARGWIWTYFWVSAVSSSGLLGSLLGGDCVRMQVGSLSTSPSSALSAATLCLGSNRQLCSVKFSLPAPTFSDVCPSYPASWKAQRLASVCTFSNIADNLAYSELASPGRACSGRRLYTATSDEDLLLLAAYVNTQLGATTSSTKFWFADARHTDWRQRRRCNLIDGLGQVTFAETDSQCNQLGSHTAICQEDLCFGGSMGPLPPLRWLDVWQDGDQLRCHLLVSDNAAAAGAAGSACGDGSLAVLSSDGVFNRIKALVLGASMSGVPFWTAGSESAPLILSRTGQVSPGCAVLSISASSAVFDSTSVTVPAASSGCSAPLRFVCQRNISTSAANDSAAADSSTSIAVLPSDQCPSPVTGSSNATNLRLVLSAGSGGDQCYWIVSGASSVVYSAPEYCGGKSVASLLPDIYLAARRYARSLPAAAWPTPAWLWGEADRWQGSLSTRLGLLPISSGQQWPFSQRLIIDATGGLTRFDGTQRAAVLCRSGPLCPSFTGFLGGAFVNRSCVFASAAQLGASAAAGACSGLSSTANLLSTPSTVSTGASGTLTVEFSALRDALLRLGLGNATFWLSAPPSQCSVIRVTEADSVESTSVSTGSCSLFLQPAQVLCGVPWADRLV